jgi:site-specific recombinase XerD
LDIYYAKRKRKKEFLGIYLEPNEDKTYRNEKLKLAENIKAKRMIELTNEEFGFPSKDKQKQNFVEYFKLQMERKGRNTKSTWSNTLNYLLHYTKGSIPFNHIDTNWLEGFIDFLLKSVSPQSASTYFSKVKCALKESVRDRILPHSPADFVKSIKVPQKEREYLTIDEIRKIAATSFKDEEVKKAFLFACYTGLRFSDIISLQWNQIKETNFNGNGITYAIHKRQTKTGIISHIPLNETALNIIGNRPNTDSLVFNLDMHHRSILRNIKRLLEAAKIDKYITFHCARHTYAIMLLANGANLMTVKELLGHRDIKSTQIYAKVVDESKVNAINNLPSI